VGKSVGGIELDIGDEVPVKRGMSKLRSPKKKTPQEARIAGGKDNGVGLKTKFGGGNRRNSVAILRERCKFKLLRSTMAVHNPANRKKNGGRKYGR